MYKTIIFSGLVLALAFGGPISLMRIGDLWRGAVGSGASATPSTTATTTEAYKPIDKMGDNPIQSSTHPTTVSLEGTPTPAMAEVLRFDISPAWVLQRWPRVSTDLARLQLHGYRVPLVTGTSQSDVAGSLTYYFNPGQQVQHITLRGTTGDPRALISFLSEHYGYVRRPNNDPSRLVFESVNSSGKPMGWMIIQSAPVVRADRPYQRYALDLTMDRPM
jgi:hypothetical protein